MRQFYNRYKVVNINTKEEYNDLTQEEVCKITGLLSSSVRDAAIRGKNGGISKKRFIVTAIRVYGRKAKNVPRKRIYTFNLVDIDTKEVMEGLTAEDVMYITGLTSRTYIYKAASEGHTVIKKYKVVANKLNEEKTLNNKYHYNNQTIREIIREFYADELAEMKKQKSQAQEREVLGFYYIDGKITFGRIRKVRGEYNG